jgi:diacylglycerol kinase family enzyme
MAPGASATDRSLDLVLFRGRGRRAMLGFARDFIRGRHLDRGDVELARVEEVELRSPAGLSVQLDGDVLPVRLPVTIRLAAERLQLLVPRAAGPPWSG